MKPRLDVLNRYRVRRGQLASDERAEACGAFLVPGPCGRTLTIVASDGTGSEAYGDGTVWEHVSVSTPKHLPNWTEMGFVKDLFWGDDEAVMQLHPPRSAYVNNHAYCLHLWRPVGREIPLPPEILVGVKDAGVIHE